MIKAIETRYKGYRFRSRLEARWAVFFDALGIEYRYEPEGFKKVLGEDDDPNPECVLYLPDFYLPKTETWVEVKGGDEAWASELTRMEEFLDYSCPMPGFIDSEIDQSYFWCRGLLVLGDVPEPIHGLCLHPIIRHRKGLWQKWAYFDNRGPHVIPDSAIHLLTYFVDANKLHENGTWTTQAITIPTPLAYPKAQEAYRAARSARFEHGENGS